MRQSSGIYSSKWWAVNSMQRILLCVKIRHVRMNRWRLCRRGKLSHFVLNIAVNGHFVALYRCKNWTAIHCHYIHRIYSPLCRREKKPRSRKFSAPDHNIKLTITEMVKLLKRRETQLHTSFIAVSIFRQDEEMLGAYLPIFSLLIKFRQNSSCTCT